MREGRIGSVEIGGDGERKKEQMRERKKRGWAGGVGAYKRKSERKSSQEAVKPAPTNDGSEGEPTNTGECLCHTESSEGTEHRLEAWATGWSQKSEGGGGSLGRSSRTQWPVFS